MALTHFVQRSGILISTRHAEGVLMLHRVLPIPALAMAALTIFPVASAAQDGWFTTAQAEQGHQLFNNYCAECHRPDLTGAAGPALVGTPFQRDWGGKPVGALFSFEHQTMPANEPGSMAPDKVWAITAYILSRNGLPPGATELGKASANRTIPSH